MSQSEYESCKMTKVSTTSDKQQRMPQCLKVPIISIKLCHKYHEELCVIFEI